MNKKILIIEDDLPLLNVLDEKISGSGIEVLRSTNGKEGLESAIRNHPDLILLDIVMPIMDGMMVLEKLRDDKWGKTAKVILLTNLLDTEKVIESRSKGVRDYLLKADYTLDDIVKMVKRRLKIRKKTSTNDFTK